MKGRELNVARALLSLSLSSFFIACSAPKPAAVAPAQVPVESQATAEKAEPLVVSPAPPRELGAKPGSVVEAPETCVKGTALPVITSCQEPLALLSDALSQEELPARDAALADLETCSRFAPGLIRALRADLGPVSCADVLTQPVFDSAVELQDAERDLLIALTYAAWLRRSSSLAPTAPSTPNKEKLAEYFQAELFPWVAAQASGIYKIATRAAKLKGYARGIVATEAGMADLRFVSIVRDVPLPEEIASFPEAVDVYYGNLEQVLDPRKNRGRDAALVGLMALGQQGVIQSERVDAARVLLSQLFGGRRINALDRLMFPEPSVISGDNSSSLESLAAHLPTAYFDAILGSEVLSNKAKKLALSQGASPGLQARMQAQLLNPHSALALGYTYLELGRTYYSAEYFQRAHQLMTVSQDIEPSDDAKTSDQLSPEEREVLSFQNALALALMAGPENALMLMAKGPRFADARANLIYLEAFAESKSSLAGAAQFDVAYLLELVAPPGAPEHWGDVAQGYEAAVGKLDGQQRERAQEYARAAREIQAELQTN